MNVQRAGPAYVDMSPLTSDAIYCFGTHPSTPTTTWVASLHWCLGGTCITSVGSFISRQLRQGPLSSLKTGLIYQTKECYDCTTGITISIILFKLHDVVFSLCQRFDYVKFTFNILALLRYDLSVALSSWLQIDLYVMFRTYDTQYGWTSMEPCMKNKIKLLGFKSWMNCLKDLQESRCFSGNRMNSYASISHRDCHAVSIKPQFSSRPRAIMRCWEMRPKIIQLSQNFIYFLLKRGYYNYVCEHYNEVCFAILPLYKII